MREALVGIAVAICLTAGPAAAQQSSGDVHADYMHGTTSKANSWGAGALYQLTFGGKQAPLQLNTSLGADWTKQENSGPSQTSLSYDATVQPGGSGSFVPYAGGSVSANWSGGSNKMWDGAKLGLETLAGFQVKLGLNGVAWKAEERFGYVREQEHTLTTRVGIAVTF
ncbi:MAG TPA: hypothetical protein VF761_13560 [Gemmatimonadaceae bacterium]